MSNSEANSEAPSIFDATSEDAHAVVSQNEPSSAHELEFEALLAEGARALQAIVALHNAQTQGENQ
jgi:hypothetical protein